MWKQDNHKKKKVDTLYLYIKLDTFSFPYVLFVHFGVCLMLPLLFIYIGNSSFRR